jgi:hypothetical protein
VPPLEQACRQQGYQEIRKSDTFFSFSFGFIIGPSYGGLFVPRMRTDKLPGGV